MDDPSHKIKQLTESLQSHQTKVSKKKEEIEALGKSVTSLDKEIYELRQVCAELEGAKEFTKDALNRTKEDLKKKTDHARRIINSDKATLSTQKQELLAKLEALQAENKKLQEQKNNLLKNKRGEVPVAEETKISEEDLRREEEENASLETLAKGVVIKKETTGFLKAETVTKIVDICVILAGRKFMESVAENRKKLRANKNIDLKSYLDQAGKEVTQHTEVYQDIEKQVLEAVHLEKSVLDKSIEYYMSTGNLEIVALMNLLGEKLKSYLRSTKDVDGELFKEIMRFKIDFIEREAPAIFGEENRRKVVQTQLATVSGTYAQKEEMSVNMLRGFFEFRLGTAIHEKFGVEEEDLRAASMKPEIQYDMDVAELMLKNEEALFKNLPQLGPQERQS